MKQVLPIILILASIGLFVFFTNKEYQQVKLLSKDIAAYDKALGKSKEVLTKRSDLQAKYAQFSNADLDALTKMIPDHVDNVQLILDLNGIARKHNMAISKIKITENQARSGGQVVAIGPDTRPYDSILVSFRTVAPYESVLSFIRDMEQGLRLVDVTDFSFKADPKNVNEYAITIRTYWLK